MEAALDAFARRVGAGDPGADDDEDYGVERVRFPFDAHRRRMSVVVGDRVFVKGAPDAVLPLCRPDPEASEVLRELAGAGLRVLTVATRDLDPDAANVEVDMTAIEALDQVRQDCLRRGIVFAMARVKQDLREALAAGGVLDEIGQDRLYMTLPTAVAAYQAWVASGNKG